MGVWLPFLRQRSMLSVTVILRSRMNSYRSLVAMAVFSPSKAPCLVLALEERRAESSYTKQGIQYMQVIKQFITTSSLTI